VGESAGPSITLPGSALRSVDLKLMGSGYGSMPLKSILAAIPTLFGLVIDGKLRIDAEAVPLADVEQAWNRVEKGRRIVFTV
jgi:Zn-dependent alcohol dehydrogenase